MASHAGPPAALKRAFKLSLLLFFFCTSLGGEKCVVDGAESAAENTLVIKQLLRRVELLGRLVKVTVVAQVHNPSERDAKSLRLAFSEDQASHLGYLTLAVEGGGVLSLKQVADYKAKVEGNKRVVFKVYEAPVPLPSGKSVTYVLNYYLGRMYAPLPKAIKFLDPPYVVFEDYEYAPSPYAVEAQETEYRVPSSSVESAKGLTKFNSTSYVTKVHDMTPAYKIGPKSIRLRFRLKLHLGYFPKVDRRIEVSHWSSIFVHEYYKFSNDAAALSEEFNRWKVAASVRSLIGRRREPNYPYPSHQFCFELDCVLPPKAYGIEFYDHIGNISSSHAKRRALYTYLQIEPRYPVAGQWNAEWFIDYNIPTASALSKLPGSKTHIVTVPLGPPVREMYTEELTTRVILPAGAHSLKVHTPREVKAGDVTIEEEFGWLGLWSPRHTVVIKARGFALPDNDLLRYNIQVLYDYTASISDYRKLVFCCIMSFFPFLLYLVLSAIDFRIVARRKGFGLWSAGKVALLAEGESTSTDSAVQRVIDSLGKACEILLQNMGSASNEFEVASARTFFRATSLGVSQRIANLVAVARLEGDLDEALRLEEVASQIAKGLDKIDTILDSCNTPAMWKSSAAAVREVEAVKATISGCDSLATAAIVSPQMKKRK